MMTVEELMNHLMSVRPNTIVTFRQGESERSFDATCLYDAERDEFVMIPDQEAQ